MIMKCHYCGKKFQHYGNYGVVWCCAKCQEVDRKMKKQERRKEKLWIVQSAEMK